MKGRVKTGTETLSLRQHGEGPPTACRKTRERREVRRNRNRESRKLTNDLRYRVGSRESGSTFFTPFSTSHAKRVYKKMYICAEITVRTRIPVSARAFPRTGARSKETCSKAQTEFAGMQTPIPTPQYKDRQKNRQGQNKDSQHNDSQRNPRLVRKIL